MDQPKGFRAIMLSSTFTDLKQHRHRAIEAISKLHYMPSVMEHSGAQAEADVIDASLRMVREAAAYIGVISLKYGQTPRDADRNPGGLSITEIEFNEAMRLGRPIILFIMDDDHTVKKADIESDPDKQKKLDAFRERAKKMHGDGEVQRVYEVFDSLEQFSTAAATAVGNLVRYLERLPPAKNADTGQISRRTIANIPINIPFHFLGREDDLAAIEAAMERGTGRAAVTALYGLRGVGKTTLAAAYAEQKSENYRATWWIRAETESTANADLMGLGVQLGWVATDAPEQQAVKAVLDRLRGGGEKILLVYDNAVGPTELTKLLPRGGAAHVIITSNAPNWGGMAASVQIEVWPKETGADFLMARTGRAAERGAALALSEALGGLPLAHEQAAAYCERIGTSLADYLGRIGTMPAILLDHKQDASREYHDGLTVAKTFMLAIDEAAKRHPAAEALIAYAALLAPEPIPLYLFSEGRGAFGEELAPILSGDGLDEAVAALRSFALLDRESIPDERDPSITTDCIRLHRLVRQVAGARKAAEAQAVICWELVGAVAEVYPEEVYRDPDGWVRARRLDAIAIALVRDDVLFPEKYAAAASLILDGLASYRQGALAAYADARPLFERALAIRNKVLGPIHSDTATSLNNLGVLLQAQGDFVGARDYYERALAVCEEIWGVGHPDTATALCNLGYLLKEQGDLAGAGPLYERALAICEKVLKPDHPDTARCLNYLGDLLQARGQLAEARSYYERALAIFERVPRLDHMGVGRRRIGLGSFPQALSDPTSARARMERTSAIREMQSGPDHPNTATCLRSLGGLQIAEGNLAGARSYYERALAIFEKRLGLKHPSTQDAAEGTAMLLKTLGFLKEAEALAIKFDLNMKTGKK